MSELSNAVSKSDLEQIKKLVSHGADITELNNHAITFSSAKGDLDIVKYLVSKGADITFNNYWAALLASENGHSKVVSFLIKEYLQKDKNSFSSLKDILQDEHVPILKKSLLEQKQNNRKQQSHYDEIAL